MGARSPYMGTRMIKTIWVGAAVLFSVQCSHAQHCAREPAPPPAAEFNGAGAAAQEGDPQLFAKFDPALRWRLGNAAESGISAIVLLHKPLPPQALAELEAAGLTVLSRGPERLHVRGDTEILLRLAAREEVRQVTSSGAVGPPRMPEGGN
jgi:hypothetical protein